MLVHRIIGREAQPAVQRLALQRRIQNNRAPFRIGQQRIHQFRADPLPLRLVRDDDHPGGAMVGAIGPPQRGADKFAIGLDRKAPAQLEGEGPILDAIGPIESLRQGMRLGKVTSLQRNRVARRRPG